MDAFIGSWRLVSSANFDEYMEALGKFFSYSAWKSIAISANGKVFIKNIFAGLLPAMRHYGNNMTTVLIFSQDGDDIVIKTKMYGTINRSITVSFKLDEEIDEHSVDFRLCKVRTFNIRLS